MQHEPLPRDVAETFHDGPGLQSGEQEEEGFSEVDDQAPKEEAVQARAGGDKPRAVPAHVEARRHGREDAGAAHHLGRPKRRVGREQG